MGSSEYAMRIWVKPDRLAKLKITASDVMSAIKAQNNIVPGGAFGDEPSKKGVQNTYTATLQQRLVSEEDFGNIILKSNPNGALVRLKDVARIELGLQMYNLSSNLNGNPSSLVAIYQIPGANGLDVRNKVKAKMEELEKNFPQGLATKVSLDTTEAITVGIEEVLHTLFEDNSRSCSSLSGDCCCDFPFFCDGSGCFVGTSYKVFGLINKKQVEKELFNDRQD